MPFRSLPLFIIVLVALLSLSNSPTAAQGDYIRADRLGITFISSIDHPANELRYQRALLLGAGWNRWPLYWDRVERSPGALDWSGYDRLVSDDLRHGLKINAILLGRPGFYGQGGGIQGLFNPIFSDGTDSPGAGKAPNAGNPWASFVYQAVQRYKPGGLLAATLGLPPDQGIRVWEAWNEPDLTMFWSASVEDYARLLKITYLVVHSVDPQAQVMFGGLAYGNPDQDDWLSRTLSIIAGDPLRETYNWYMDIAAVHSYTYPRRTYLVIRRVRENLARFGLSRPIWLNESGVPVWDDYPGPTWAGEQPNRQLRATTEQAAYFFIQSTAYAWAQGASVVFYHQLFDDCGNQPAGTDFAPNAEKLCETVGICFGDAFGIYRNTDSALCFSQHPEPASPRPIADAYLLMAELFGTGTLENTTQQEVDNLAALITFDQPESNRRLYVFWSRILGDVRLNLPAGGESGTLYSLEGQQTLTPDAKGVYALDLPAATCDYFPFTRSQDVTAIGGEPFILSVPLDAQADAKAVLSVERLQPDAPRRCQFYPGMATPPPPPTPTPTATPPEPTPEELTETPAPGG